MHTWQWRVRRHCKTFCLSETPLKHNSSWASFCTSGRVFLHPFMGHVIKWSLLAVWMDTCLMIGCNHRLPHTVKLSGYWVIMVPSFGFTQAHSPSADPIFDIPLGSGTSQFSCLDPGANASVLPSIPAICLPQSPPGCVSSDFSLIPFRDHVAVKQWDAGLDKHTLLLNSTWATDLRKTPNSWTPSSSVWTHLLLVQVL